MEEREGLVAERLERFRKKLLDTSRRNRLVNFRSRTLKGDRPLEKVVVVEGESPTKILNALVSEPRTMGFIGVPDRGQTEDLDLPAAGVYETDGDEEVDQDDDKLNTKLTRTRLDRHLTKIRRDQVEMIEEQGINALFLALGMVEWYEADHSKEKRTAPLILLPVLLDRTERGGFKVKWDGTELGSNLSLAALFKEEFGIDLPILEGDEIDVEAYFDNVESAIANQPTWRVDRGAIALAFFSFAKYLIYKDLSPSSWPSDKPILSHAILDALLGSGFPEGDDSLPEDSFLDDHRPVGETNEVFDADGSQTLAILQALKGHSMVIEGPPGTGKSQTIANLIAEFVGQGKKVLFVSEKSAALNVVYDRLKGAGLTGACLELHGTKANKRSFYQHLRDTMEQASPRLADAESLLRKLGTQRSELNRYVHDLHQPLEHRKVSPREAIGRLVSLGMEPDTDGRLRTEPMMGWTKTDFQVAKEAVEALQLQLRRIGRPTEHPFFGSERSYISPDDKADLARTIGQTLQAFKEFEGATETLTTRLNLEVPDRMAEVEDLETVISFVISSPDCSGVDFTRSEWAEGAGRFLEAIEKGRTAAEVRSKHRDEITDEGWSADVAAIERLLVAPGEVAIPHDSSLTWQALDEGERAAHAVIRTATQVSQVLSVKLPTTLWAMEPHAELASRMAKAPDCRSVQIDTAKWLTEAEAIRGALSSAKKLAELKAALQPAVKPDSWSKPIASLIDVLERDGKHFLRRLFGGEFRAARQAANSLLSKPSATLGGLVEILRSIHEAQAAEATIAASSATLNDLFGDRWRGAESAFGDLENCAQFLSRVHADIEGKKVPRDILTALYQPTTLAALSGVSEQLRRDVAHCAVALDSLQTRLEVVKPGHAVGQTGDPKERLFKFVCEPVKAAREASEAMFTPGGRGAPWHQVVERLVGCEEVQTAEHRLAELEALMTKCLGSHWSERAGNWDSLEGLVIWTVGLVSGVQSGELPKGLLNFFQQRSSKDGLSQELAGLRELRATYATCIDSVAAKAELSGGSEAFINQDLPVQERRIEAWAAHVDELESYFRYNALAKQCTDLGMSQAVDLAQNWPKAEERLVVELERAWFNLLMDEAMVARPLLREFDRQSHEEMVESFKTLDRTLIEFNRVRVASSHWRSVPRSSAVGEVGFIRMQMNRQRGHRAIRMAMREAPSAVQAIKPVFLMSPMSVAMYLPPEGPSFDVVLFDEASQIKPEDALGSVIRAGQIIVVGDTKQMPPTSFFDRLTATEETDEDEFVDVQTKDIAEQESILAFASFRIPEGSPCRRDLRWHYRSRHEDLIRTSNRLFYKDRLVIFPHPQRSGSEMGLVLRHSPTTVYGRGNTRKNELEAKEVAQAALEHVRSCPGLSLGIVAFSKAQQEAIEDQLDLFRKQDPALREFDERHGLDRLFVKNLESVQGDERDVIFISVGYGRDENGFLAMSFGPLTRDGGERRLNVLITRARVRTVVFSNFKAADMRMAESRGEGVKALHTFLAFAESGHLDVMPSILRMEPSYFEECVFEQLRNRGHDVDKQVGSEGFYIDLAVRHPSEPGRYVLGIECDGAMYHSARSARDRDRLRQQVLEDRGWKIHRIWSTDWWRHPDRELNRCCEAIDMATAVRPSSTSEPNPVHETRADTEEVLDSEVVRNESPVDAPIDHRSDDSVDSPEMVHTLGPPVWEYVKADLAWPGGAEIIDMRLSTLAGFVRQVVDVEAPIHIDEVINRIREAAGKGRAGATIRAQITLATFEAIKAGMVETRPPTASVSTLVNGVFLYSPDQEGCFVRSRASFPQTAKKIDLVSPEEVTQAGIDVLSESISAEIAELAKHVCYRLGFDRATDEMRDHVIDILQTAQEKGVFLQRGTKLAIGLAPPSMVPPATYTRVPTGIIGPKTRQRRGKEAPHGNQEFRSEEPTTQDVDALLQEMLLRDEDDPEHPFTSDFPDDAAQRGFIVEAWQYCHRHKLRVDLNVWALFRSRTVWLWMNKVTVVRTSLTKLAAAELERRCHLVRECIAELKELSEEAEAYPAKQRAILALEGLAKMVAKIGDDIDDIYSNRSESWQDSEAGARMSDWHDLWFSMSWEPIGGTEPLPNVITGLESYLIQVESLSHRARAS